MSLGLAELAQRRRQTQKSGSRHYGRSHAATADFRRPDECAGVTTGRDRASAALASRRRTHGAAAGLKHREVRGRTQARPAGSDCALPWTMPLNRLCKAAGIGALLATMSACAAAPINKPIPTTRVDNSSPGTLARSAQVSSKGRWTLESFEVRRARKAADCL